MSADVRGILTAAFDAAAAQADELSAVYQQRLADYQAHALALTDDLASGAITVEQAVVAAEQEKNALASTLLEGAYDANSKAQAAALAVVLAVLKAALVAAV